MSVTLADIEEEIANQSGTTKTEISLPDEQMHFILGQEGVTVVQDAHDTRNYVLQIAFRGYVFEHTFPTRWWGDRVTQILRDRDQQKFSFITTPATVPARSTCNA